MASWVMEFIPHDVSGFWTHLSWCPQNQEARSLDHKAGTQKKKKEGLNNQVCSPSHLSKLFTALTFLTS